MKIWVFPNHSSIYPYGIQQTSGNLFFPKIIQYDNFMTNFTTITYTRLSFNSRRFSYILSDIWEKSNSIVLLCVLPGLKYRSMMSRSYKSKEQFRWMTRNVHSRLVLCKTWYGKLLILIQKCVSVPVIFIINIIF